MKEEEIKEKAKNHIESFVGYDDDDDLEMKVNLFTEGYYFALQQINKNDVIGGVKELLFKKIDSVLKKYERDIENANDQKALDFLEYIKAKRNGAKGMANLVKRHFE